MITAKTALKISVLPLLFFLTTNAVVHVLFYLNEVVQGYHHGPFTEFELHWFGKAVQAGLGSYVFCNTVVSILESQQSKAALVSALLFTTIVTVLTIWNIKPSWHPTFAQIIELGSLLSITAIGAWLPYYNLKK